MPCADNYNNGDWRPCFIKCRPEHKRKTITLYACPTCKGKGCGQKEDIEPKNWCVTIGIWWPCATCKQTGRLKRTNSVKEKDYYKIMKTDRQLAGMPFRGKRS